MKVSVEKATMVHFDAAFPDIRRADMAEWFAGTGDLFHIGATRCLEESEVSLVALSGDGFPLCFWGGTGGRLWLFATETAERHALSLHRILRPELDYLMHRWGLLYAVADARNTVHHTWMRWLGFTQMPAIELPPFDLPFITFILDSEDQRCASTPSPLPV